MRWARADEWLGSWRSHTPQALLKRNFAHHERLSLGDRTILSASFITRGVLFSDMLTRSAAIAYTFVFSLIPLVATTLAFFTAFPTLQDQRDHLMEFLSEQLLPGAVQGVQAYLERFSSRAATAGTISSISFIIINLLLFQSVETTFNGIWRVERGRSWGERLQALGVFFLIGTVGVTLLVILQREGSAFSEQVSKLRFLNLGQHLLSLFIGVGNLVVACGLFVTVNKVLPNTKVRWGPALAGGIIAGLVWHALKAGFTWYITNFGNYSKIYGALGAIPIFFLWVYLSFLLLMIGSYTAFVTQNLKPLIFKSQAGRSPVAFYAIAVCVVLARAFREERGALTIEQIAQHLGVSSYFVNEALNTLCENDIVLGVSGGPDPAYVLAKPAEALSLHRIVSPISSPAFTIPQFPPHAPAIYRVVEPLFRDALQDEASILGRVTVHDLINQELQHKERATPSERPAERWH